METDDKKAFVKEMLNDYLNPSIIRTYRRYTPTGALFDGRFNRTISNFYKKKRF